MTRNKKLSPQLLYYYYRVPAWAYGLILNVSYTLPYTTVLLVLGFVKLSKNWVLHHTVSKLSV